MEIGSDNFIFIFEATKSRIVARWSINLWYHFHVILWFFVLWLFMEYIEDENNNSTSTIQYTG